MNKILRNSFVALLAMVGLSSAQAKEVVIDFNAMDLACSHGANKDQGIEESTVGDILEAKTITVEGVDVIISPKEEENKNNNRFWETKNGPQLRCYSGTITIKSSEALKTIEFTSATNKFNLTAAVGTLDGTKWTGEANEVVFTVAGNTQLDKIVINGDSGSDPEPNPGDDTLVGEGTQGNPYLASDAYKIGSKLESGAKTEDVYVKGIISEIKYEFDADHGTATFFITDHNYPEDVKFQVYGAYYLENKAWVDGNTQIKVGDEVVIYGKITNYQGTPETASKEAYIYMLNGNTKNEGGDTPEPQVEEIDVTKALEIIAALEDGAKTTEEYKVKGFIVGAPDFQRKDDGTLYGNVNFDMAAEKGGSNLLTVFRAKSFEGEAFTEESIGLLKADDEVVIQGKLQKYVKDGVTTPEIATGGKLISVNGQTSVNAIKKDSFKNAPAYNLAGQRVSDNYKGLVIKGGKKVIVK